MSTLRIFVRCNLRFLDNCVLNAKNTPLIRYSSYFSHRNIWSTLIQRKEEIPSSQKYDDTVEHSEKNTEQYQIEDLLTALEELKHNRDEINDKYKRALAENENIRKRLLKQIDEAKLFAVQAFCKDLLEVADVLNKATECVPKEEVTDNNPHLKNLYEGLTMTESILKNVFKRHGLTIMNPLHEKFNPDYHEALFQQEVQGKPEGTVVVVSKPGYKLHERVVRPALVGVSK